MPHSDPNHFKNEALDWQDECRIWAFETQGFTGSESSFAPPVNEAPAPVIPLRRGAGAPQLQPAELELVAVPARIAQFLRDNADALEYDHRLKALRLAYDIERRERFYGRGDAS